MANVPGRVESFELEPAKLPRIPLGLSSVLGVLAALGAVVAAIHGNDVATAVGGIAGIVAMGGRYAQAVTLARSLARASLPWVQAVAELPEPTVNVVRERDAHVDPAKIRAEVERATRDRRPRS